MKLPQLSLRELFLLVVIAAMGCGPSHADEAERATFKRLMMPKVGKEVTVSGTLKNGKVGDVVVTDEGGSVYLLPTKDEDVRKADKILNPLQRKTIRVTGKLLYRPYFPPPKSEKPEGVAPKHFYMDVMKARIEQVINPK